ncbi:MAG: histidine kinase [Lachnospiraceae bacterium]|nr:histidine kinase [Lachnospiraceae bacterium]
MGWIDITNLIIVSAGIALTLSGLILSISLHNIEHSTRVFFIVFFSILTAYAASDLTSQISLVFLGESFAWLSRLAIFLESFLSSLLMPALTYHLLVESKETSGGKLYMQTGRPPVLNIVLGLWGIYVLLLVITQYTTGIYCVTAQNVYKRGPYYPLLLISPILLMLVNLIALIKRRSRLSRRTRIAFFSYIAIPLLGMLIQMWFYGLLLIPLFTVIAASVMFIFLLVEQTDRIIKQKEENLRNRMNIQVLLMRPHFILNTLSSIYYLCGSDPLKAQKTIDDFTKYLRNNFNALVKKGLIPFEDELEHTKAYLSVEKSRYETLLYVEYDITHTFFQLPPLTLQPIVENAVKHGVDPELKPLNVFIRTFNTDNESVIIVEDTGPGFGSEEYLKQPLPENGTDLHLGLENVKERLRLECGGSLEITERKGGGTVVTIRIPDKRK